MQAAWHLALTIEGSGDRGSPPGTRRWDGGRHPFVLAYAAYFSAGGWHFSKPVFLARIAAGLQAAARRCFVASARSRCFSQRYPLASATDKGPGLCYVPRCAG